MIHVLVLDRDRVTAESLAGALSAAEGIRAERIALSAREVLETVARPCMKVDVVVATAHLPEEEILGLATELREADKGHHLVVTGMPTSEAVILRYLEAGVDAYLTEDLSLAGLLLVLRLLAREEVIVSPAVARRLIRRLHDVGRLLAPMAAADIRGLDRLTPRERQILEFLARERSNKQISRELHISIGTVKSHVHAVLKKLGVSRRQEARRVLLATRTGTEGARSLREPAAERTAPVRRWRGVGARGRPRGSGSAGS